MHHGLAVERKINLSEVQSCKPSCRERSITNLKSALTTPRVEIISVFLFRCFVKFGQIQKKRDDFSFL